LESCIRCKYPIMSALRAVFYFLVLLFLASCSLSENGKFRLGVSIPTQREERWVRDVQKLRSECRRKNIDMRLQISDNDAARQLAQCENLIAQKISILILAPHDAFAASVIVEKAHRAGIRVITYDRLVMKADVDLYISFDNLKIGELQGQFITHRVPKGAYVVLAGAPTDNNATLYRQGAMKFIQPFIDKGDIRVVMDQAVKDWQPMEAMKLIENALTANGNRIDAVLAPNDGTAGGVIQALAGRGLAGKVPVTGQDSELAAAHRIVEGIQTMTIFKDTRELAVEAVEAAEKMASGRDPGVNNAVYNGKINVPSILLTAVVVDRDNLDRVLIGSGYLKREDVYR